MAEKMKPIPFKHMLEWIFREYELKKTIFEIPSQKFYHSTGNSTHKIFNELLETPVGPAAGPHTQLAQNIVCSYLVGGRFFELKTVQKLDKLEIKKPCIDISDEGYNTEWSQELTLEESFDEYLKAWFLIHILKDALKLSSRDAGGFIFNMSVGYDLEGIKSERMDQFIKNIINAKEQSLFTQYKEEAANFIKNSSYQISDFNLIKTIDNISENISSSVTLSTMHGCPPDEIERIISYLVKEKNLHTYVKLNPTLLGFDFVHKTLSNLGYDYFVLNEDSFKRDLQFEDAASMITRLKALAKTKDKSFGVKLSNTLGVSNYKNVLPEKEMYMSGRSLFPLTINLANKLANEFSGKLNISFSGGADAANIKQILHTGIYPVTMVTDLLKPGGYFKLKQIADEASSTDKIKSIIDLKALGELAETSFNDYYYNKDKRIAESIKIPLNLKKFDCYVAPCQQACPIHQDIPAYIKLVEEKKYTEALKVIYSKNPLPHITGYICDHQCQFHCTRLDYDEPVLIREIKKEAALIGYDDYVKQIFPFTSSHKLNLRAAIIGAGPSGLSAAYFLALSGIDVTIFEKEKSAGGIVNNVLPKFRLPQDVLEKDIDFITKLGVKINFNAKEIFSIDALKEDGYKYIYISIGAAKSNVLKIGDGKDKVINAIEFLRKFRNDEKINLGINVAIIGGGNSAMDGARAAKRMDGVENVFIIYRRTKKYMPADLEEFNEAINEGVIFKELLSPISFETGILTLQKMQLSDFDKEGRRKVVNEIETMQIDTIISAIGEQVDLDILSENNLLIKGDSQIQVNELTHETKIENVFIGGDALHGPSTVVEAIADAKKAADAILQKEDVSIRNLSDLTMIKREETELTILKGHISSAKKEKISEETARCLHCDFICNKCVEVCPNRANVLVESKLLESKHEDTYQVLHLDAICNECGNCETFCPYYGSPYKDKITLFWSEDDFENSTNDGFLISSDAELLDIKVRFQSQEGHIQYYKAEVVISSSLVNTAPYDRIIEFGDFIFTVYENYKYLFPQNSV